ncbi:hypothetical protein EVAR_99128_1 [Eumeta japonica]|uniref:Uncharacterized protein n=1 Tax=Eumeta variegata TaxID=151549 RepID=A0A4C1YSC8_EUMVA|nr:hypothetical protein EVAR_99128_1 [Eumeta japonica]
MLCNFITPGVHTKDKTLTAVSAARGNAISFKWRFKRAGEGRAAGRGALNTSRIYITLCGVNPPRPRQPASALRANLCLTGRTRRGRRVARQAAANQTRPLNNTFCCTAFKVQAVWRALATSRVQYSNARGREKERYTKVENRREKERIGVGNAISGKEQQDPIVGIRLGLRESRSSGLSEINIRRFSDKGRFLRSGFIRIRIKVSSGSLVRESKAHQFGIIKSSIHQIDHHFRIFSQIIKRICRSGIDPASTNQKSSDARFARSSVRNKADQFENQSGIKADLKIVIRQDRRRENQEEERERQVKIKG